MRLSWGPMAIGAVVGAVTLFVATRLFSTGSTGADGTSWLNGLLGVLGALVVAAAPVLLDHWLSARKALREKIESEANANRVEFDARLMWEPHSPPARSGVLYLLLGHVGERSIHIDDPILYLLAPAFGSSKRELRFRWAGNPLVGPPPVFAKFEQRQYCVLIDDSFPICDVPTDDGQVHLYVRYPGGEWCEPIEGAANDWLKQAQATRLGATVGSGDLEFER